MTSVLMRISGQRFQSFGPNTNGGGQLNLVEAEIFRNLRHAPCCNQYDQRHPKVQRKTP